METLVAQPESKIVDLTLIEKVRSQIARAPRVEAPVQCVFTPGLMTRAIFMPSGSRHLSKIHKTRHQYFVMQGSCLVSENGEEPVLLVAPYNSVTEPGTWRELFILSDCVWITAHPTQKKTVAEVEAEIIADSQEDGK